MVLYELPQGWTWAPLGDLAEITGGGTPNRSEPRYYDGGMIPWITPTDLDALRISMVSTAKTNITETGLAASSAKLLPIGTVLFSSRASIGKIGIASVPLATNQGFANFTPYKGIDSRYLAYGLRFFTEGIKELASGTTFPEVSKSVIRNFMFPVPPSSEQLRIALALESFIDQSLSARETLGGVPSLIKEFRQAILRAAFSGRLTERGPEDEPVLVLLERIKASRRHRWEEELNAKGKDPSKAKYEEPAQPDNKNLPELPKGWVWSQIGRIAEIVGGIQKTPARVPRNSAYPYLRVANVLNGKLDLSEVHQFELAAGELERWRLEPGDLLIVEGNGSISQIGRCAIWGGEIENCVHQNHIIRVRPSEGIEPQFLQYYLSSNLGRNALESVASSTSGLFTLSVSKIEKLAVPIASGVEQRELCRQLDRLLSAIDDIGTAVDIAERQRTRLQSAVLQMSFEGELVPQDPQDEPASALLARIRQEKALQLSFLAQKPPSKSSGGTGGSESMERKTYARRPLYEVLKEAGKPLRPEDLLIQAGFDQEGVDEFYDELRQQIRQAQILETRPDVTTVLLKVADG